MILLVILVILAALVLFAVWPGAKREDLRALFYGRNYAHRGYFGKDQRPPENIQTGNRTENDKFRTCYEQ